MTLEGFGNFDTYLRAMRELNPLEFVRCSQVCRSWYSASKAAEKHVFKPLHEQARLWVKDDKYSCKSWVVLNATLGNCHPRDLYVKYLGEPIGSDAEATAEQIEELCKFNRRDPKVRKFKNYQAVHIYAQVRRTTRNKETATIDSKGKSQTLKPQLATTSEKEVVVDLSTHNLIKLFQHRLGGKKSESVFAHVDPQVFEQCNSAPMTSSVVFVKRGVPKVGRNKTWDTQVDLLSDTQIAGIRPLLLLCGFDILETGTCEYGEKTCVRTSDMIQMHGRALHLALGHYFPSLGLGIYSYYGNYAHPHISAVPCIAPVPMPIALETLDPETQEYSELLEMNWPLFWC